MNEWFDCMNEWFEWMNEWLEWMNTSPRLYSNSLHTNPTLLNLTQFKFKFKFKFKKGQLAWQAQFFGDYNPPPYDPDAVSVFVFCVFLLDFLFFYFLLDFCVWERMELIVSPRDMITWILFQRIDSIIMITNRRIEFMITNRRIEFKFES
jgi:hypothetical protein